MKFKSISIPVIGLPNAGKSTLINSLTGKKISIITHKPHTTRSMIIGVMKEENKEVIFIDTPGMKREKSKLSKKIYSSMQKYLKEIEECLLILDASKHSIPSEFEEIIPKSILILNKIDLVRKPKLLLLIDEISKLNPLSVFLISATEHDGIKDLKNYLFSITKECEELESTYINQNVGEYACECVREKILSLADQEIPYQILIEPVLIDTESPRWHIELKIVVPKDGYKGILIGKKGEMLKNIGESARLELVSYFKRPGFLGLKIVVEKNLWEKDETYQKLGWK